MSPSETSGPGRRGAAAALLSVFCIGLGQIYTGAPRLGLALLLASALLAPAPLLAARFAPSDLVLAAVLVAVSSILLMYLGSILDAWFRARRINPTRRPALHHPGLYAMFLLVGSTYAFLMHSVARQEAFQAFRIVEASMTPTLADGDRVLVNRHTYRKRTPERGDVVVLRNPDDRRRHFVKRIVGLPGDPIEISEDGLTVAGHHFPSRTFSRDDSASGFVTTNRDVRSQGLAADSRRDDARAAQTERRMSPQGASESTTTSKASRTARVPRGMCFVLGDNFDRSFDSRHFGCVPLGDVLGPVQYRFYSAETRPSFEALTMDRIAPE